jgi:hypothetical protein
MMIEVIATRMPPRGLTWIGSFPTLFCAETGAFSDSRV